jgi:hypothetical protein
MKSKYIWGFVTLTFVFLASRSVFAWGGRGHHTVCEAAVHLLKEQGLKDLFQIKPHVLGHLCNVPDIHWKDMGPEARKIGSPAHYINGEVLGLKPAEIPTDYKKLIADFTGTKNKYKDGTIISVPTSLGSNWWRADQFFRRAIALEKDFKAASAPTNFSEEQNYEFPYNKAVYSLMVNLGLMGHFVGDNGQPYHSSADYDGFDSGHGGIHGFYEDAVVAEMSHTLLGKIVDEGKKLQKAQPHFLKKETVVEKMRELSQVSFDDRKKVWALDPVITPSTEKNEKGMQIREKAKRKPARTVAKKYEPLVVLHMARSASLLAQLWDLAYQKVGSPDLTKYRSYQHPFTPEFVNPDYFEIENEKK